MDKKKSIGLSNLDSTLAAILELQGAGARPFLIFSKCLCCSLSTGTCVSQPRQKHQLSIHVFLFYNSYTIATAMIFSDFDSFEKRVVEIYFQIFIVQNFLNKNLKLKIIWV